MKNSLLFLATCAATSFLFAGHFLEGQTFSRTFVTKPLGSTVEREFSHRLTFGSDWDVVDNYSTWFGNPPITCQYGIEWKDSTEKKASKVVVLCNGAVTRYTYVDTHDSIELTDKAVVLKLTNKDEL